jgi:integrase/recombinase XerD
MQSGSSTSASDTGWKVLMNSSASLALAAAVRMRASELVGLRCSDVVLGTGAHIKCLGKGRKERSTPLRRDTARAVQTWLKERRGDADQPLFPSIRGDRLSRDALEHLVRKHCLTASRSCPSLAVKRVSPHTLRHSTAMELLQHGVDQSVIALWLGHESIETTQIYLHADMRMKEKALARVTTPETRPSRYRPDTPAPRERSDAPLPRTGGKAPRSGRAEGAAADEMKFAKTYPMGRRDAPHRR